MENDCAIAGITAVWGNTFLSRWSATMCTRRVEHCHLENKCIPILLWHRDHTRDEYLVNVSPAVEISLDYYWVIISPQPKAVTSRTHASTNLSLLWFSGRSPAACKGFLTVRVDIRCPFHFSSFSISLAMMKRAIEALVLIYWSCLLVVKRGHPLRGLSFTSPVFQYRRRRHLTVQTLTLNWFATASLV